MTTPISIYTSEQVDGITRFFRDDRFPSGERIYFIQADYVRHLMINKNSPYASYHHNDKHIEEVVSTLEDAVGMVFPEDFAKGTTIYNVPGILMDQGRDVSLRVLRQQIFLGGSPFPIVREQTEYLLFHAIGNAIWNFLDYNVWSGDNSKKNEYRQLRGIELKNQRRNKNNHQDSLFYIASEDFRYLFGTASAGRGEWNLSHLGIAPPHVESVSIFWRRELEAYGGSQKEEIQENVQIA